MDRSNRYSIAGALVMLAGAALYFADNASSTRGWHLLLFPAMILMAIGAILAFVGELSADA